MTAWPTVPTVPDLQVRFLFLPKNQRLDSPKKTGFDAPVFYSKVRLHLQSPAVTWDPMILRADWFPELEVSWFPIFPIHQ